MNTYLLSSCLFLAAGVLAAPSDESTTGTEQPDDIGIGSTEFGNEAFVSILPDLKPGARLGINVQTPHELLRNTADAGSTRDSSVCGIRRSSVPDVFHRVVGGSPAEEHEFPWQVSIQWRYNWYTYHVCGAAVIDQNWVLTAAHCTHQFTTKDLLVVAGDHMLKQKEGTEQNRYIETIIEHPNYDTHTQENDIALIKLATPLELDGMSVSPVCLPRALTNFTGECVVTGWGKLNENGVSADSLQKVVMPIITDQECEDAYRIIGYTGPVARSMLCAGFEQGGKDACQGDSGGPYVCRGTDNRYQLAGIVSWGVGCARPNVPGVYTEVSMFVDWIAGVVNGAVTDFPNRPANLRSSLVNTALDV